MRRLIPICLASCVAGAIAIYFATSFYERPSGVRVAVTNGTTDHDLVAALAKAASDDSETVRFKIVPVGDPGAAAAALDRGDADLAVVRTDVGMPKKGATVAILHRGAALFALPGGSTIDSESELAGRKIGVLHALPGAPGNDLLLGKILAQDDLSPRDVSIVPLEIGGVESAAREGRIDVLFTVGVPSGGPVAEALAAYARGVGKAPKLLPVSEAKAMSQLSPAYEVLTLSKGAYGGAGTRPADEMETLGVSTRRVARNTKRDGLVGEITRIVFAERPTIAQTVPLGNWIEAPSTDKGLPLSAHSGTAAYLDGEQETFMEKYSDYIYIGAMVLSVFGSGGAALFSRLNAHQHARIDALLQRLLEILRATREAKSTEDLDELEQEADTILIEALSDGSIRFLDGHRVPALSIAMEQVRVALRRQRTALAAGSSSPVVRLAARAPAALAGE